MKVKLVIIPVLISIVIAGCAFITVSVDNKVSSKTIAESSRERIATGNDKVQASNDTANDNDELNVGNSHVKSTVK
jgi:hypothetical protein